MELTVYKVVLSISFKPKPLISITLKQTLLSHLYNWWIQDTDKLTCQLIKALVGSTVTWGVAQQPDSSLMWPDFP